MKPEKKTISARKAAVTKKVVTKKSPSQPVKTTKTTPVKASAPKPAKKPTSKVADFVESAIATTKKAATKVKEIAEKAGTKLKAAAKTKGTVAPATKKVISTAATKAREMVDKVETKAKAAVEKVSTPKASTKVVAKKKTFEIPAILLEGDQPSSHPASGPGQRYSLGPTPPTEHFDDLGDLPDAYGTKRLILTARDPHWLYAHWDLTREQLKKYNGLSTDGHLVLRVYKNEIAGEPATQVHVHPESRNWFIHVGHGGTRFIAELGYYNRSGHWVQVSASGSTLTPPDALSEDTSVRFATIPVDVPFEQLVKIIKAAIKENVPLAEAIMQLRAEGFKNLPAPSEFTTATWTPAQERALASIITMDTVRRVWIGSLEITELIRRQLALDVSSMGAAQFSLPSSISLGSLSSPFGGMERQKGFWFNVNAELIIYGATEPDAKVTIGDREIKLRPDGTFSYRFILPDGNYDLPAQATSADGDDSRSAHLKFSRDTKYRGEVGAHPQDKNMKAPLVVNVA